ncbi:MAG: hypothetical protein R3D26_22320 [Cyanobacteriota/Melainabacteria group bacterium]
MAAPDKDSHDIPQDVLEKLRQCDNTEYSALNTIKVSKPIKCHPR